MSVERNAHEIANEAKEAERKSIALATSRKWNEIEYLVRETYARTICEVARRIKAGEFECFVRDDTGALGPVDDAHPLMLEVHAFVFNRCEATVGQVEEIKEKFHRDLSYRRSGSMKTNNEWVNIVTGTPSTVRYEKEHVPVSLIISKQWETDLWLKERDPRPAAPRAEGNAECDTEDDQGHDTETAGRRAQQLALIELVIRALGYPDRMALPEGAKQAIRAECLKFPALFTPSSFGHAWTAGISGRDGTPRFRMANHEGYRNRH